MGRTKSLFCSCSPVVSLLILTRRVSALHLEDLQYDPSMKMHCVYNGRLVDSPRGWDLNELLR